VDHKSLNASEFHWQTTVSFFLDLPVKTKSTTIRIHTRSDPAPPAGWARFVCFFPPGAAAAGVLAVEEKVAAAAALHDAHGASCPSPAAPPRRHSPQPQQLQLPKRCSCRRGSGSWSFFAVWWLFKGGSCLTPLCTPKLL